MAEVKNKVVTVESLKTKHDYDEKTYLKKSGGTMTGDITLSGEGDIVASSKDFYFSHASGDTTHRSVLLGGDSYDSGASIYLNGKDYSSDKGRFLLRAANDANSVNLIGQPDGTLTWGGKDVAVRGDYLPISGGSLTGDIVLANEHGCIYAVDYTKGVEGVQKEIIVGQTLEGNTSIGYGNYYEQSGSTNIYGDSITMTSRTAGLNEREYGVNKILWDGGEGGLHMNANQTITLLDTVFHQPNGIALIWSEYDVPNNTIRNQGFVTQFIPKILVALQPERFHSFPFMLWSDQEKHFSKGLYISDGSITGHEINTNSSDPTAPVNAYVLRYVIGV